MRVEANIERQQFFQSTPEERDLQAGTGATSATAPGRHSGDLASPPRRAGDGILERYLPNAPESVREVARESLYRLADLVIEVNERLLAENPQPGIRANDGGAVDSDSPQGSP